MRDKICADCAGWDIEWMHKCSKHPGVEYCRGCECPFCAEDEREQRDHEEDERLDMELNRIP